MYTHPQQLRRLRVRHEIAPPIVEAALQQHHAAATDGFVRQREALEQEMASFIATERGRMEAEAALMDQLVAKHRQQLAELQLQRDALGH